MEEPEEKIINESNLLEIGFIKQFEHLEDGFYRLSVDTKFYLTVGIKNLVVSIHLAGYGHIERLNHIKTIKQIKDLVFALTGKTRGDEISFAPTFEDHKYTFSYPSLLQPPSSFDYLRTLQLLNYTWKYFF